MTTNHQQIQKVQFEKIAEKYEKTHLDVCRAAYQVTQTHFYPRLKGKRVLDIGNGGQNPERVLGRELSEQVPFFVGLDNSFEMLNRLTETYFRVAASGFSLPFKDRAFDYILLNGVIHHLGFTACVANEKRLEAFLLELQRVCINEILVYEIFLPKWLERMQKFAARMLMHMPTFVLSESTLDRVLANISQQKKERVGMSLAKMTHPFFLHLVIMDYPWFKVFACLSPFKHVFFTVPVNATRLK